MEEVTFVETQTQSQIWVDFAAAAMSSLIQDPEYMQHEPDQLASDAGLYADAMLDVYNTRFKENN